MAGLEGFYGRPRERADSGGNADSAAADGDWQQRARNLQWMGGGEDLASRMVQMAASSSASRAAPPPQYDEYPQPHLQYPRENPPGVVAGRSPALPSAAPASSSSSPSPTTDRYAGLGFGITGLVADFFVSHPFVVLRRQCQVNNASLRHHRTPFTLLPVVGQLNRRQGFGCLWKGIGSTLTVRGLTLAAEDCASKFTPWPKEVDRHSSLRMVGQHLLLKAVSLVVVSPFYSASLVETVQSEIASERPGILDVFRDGFSRILNWSSPHSGRMLPVWLLMPPTVAHGVVHYSTFVVASSLAHTVIQKTHRQRQRAKGAVAKETCVLPGLAQYHDQLASLIGHLTADVLLYPVETILHRLHMQGCRILVDNLDSGREVMPILTRYEGFFDCLSTVLDEEGAAGLFRGFGALVLQYLVQFAVIRFSATVVAEVTRIVRQEGGGATAPQEVIAALQQHQPERLQAEPKPKRLMPQASSSSLPLTPQEQSLQSPARSPTLPQTSSRQFDGLTPSSSWHSASQRRF